MADETVQINDAFVMGTKWIVEEYNSAAIAQKVTTQYCPSQADTSRLGVIAIAAILLYVAGLRFLEGYCRVLPPPSDEFSSQPKRPAVYLLKIVWVIATSFLLLPAVIKVYIPNMMGAVRALSIGSNVRSGGTLTREVPDWACDAEVLASTSSNTITIDHGASFDYYHYDDNSSLFQTEHYTTLIYACGAQ